ncbi:MAG: DUF4321 domain-containing protein [Nitrospirota bacterium]|nr:DUF4321 domain-containing protein [Nitrospirota bacterium]
MAILRKSNTVLLGFVMGGGFFGSVLAEALKRFSSEGLLRDVFLKGFGIGINPPFTLDLHLFSFTLGFTIAINLFVVLGALFGVLVYKQV